MKKNKASFVPLAIFYALIFMARGGFGSYIGLYYSSIKLSNAEIGIIASVGSFIGLFGQPLWGGICDRAENKNRILSLTLMLTALSIWFLPLSGKNFWLLVLASAFFGFFENTVIPQSDSIAIELAHNADFNFSLIRTIGSLGFALMAAVAGNIFSQNIFYIFVVFSLLRITSFFVSLWIPPVRGYKKEENLARLWDIFKDKKLVYIYLYVFLLSCTTGFFYSFHAIYSEEVGISRQLLGLGIMAGSFSQFPFMLFFDWLYKKLGIVKILLFSGLIFTIRWFLYAVALTPNTIILLWLLHGGNYMVLYLCLAEYVSTNVAKELRTRGQMVNAIILSGISSIFGSTIGGIISQAIGIGSTFLLSSVICLFAVTGFFIITRLKPEFKGDLLNNHKKELPV